jgi:hypothetical protein
MRVPGPMSPMSAERMKPRLTNTLSKVCGTVRRAWLIRPMTPRTALRFLSGTENQEAAARLGP